MGNLYVISTPIGNLDDITLRAIRVLKNVSLIAAENVYHSKKLLNHYEINTDLTSYHDKNKKIKADILLDELQKGKDIALITDAGTPCISDPGYLIVKKCRQNNINVVPVPGAASPIVALSVSGFPTDEFKFIGFLPHSKIKRGELLKKIVDENITTICFDSPNRIMDTLELAKDICGDKLLFLAREVTKIYEEFILGSSLEIIKKLKEGNLRGKIKGEITLIISKDKIKKNNDDIKQLIIKEFKKFQKQALPTNELAKIISEKHSIPKKLVYKYIVQSKE